MPLRAECRNLVSLRPPHIFFLEVYCDQEKNYQNPSCSVLSFMIIKIVLDKKRLVENPTDRWQDLQSSTLSQRFSHPLLLKKLWHLISSIDIFLNAYLRSDFQPMSKRKSRLLLNQQHSTFAGKSSPYCAQPFLGQETRTIPRTFLYCISFAVRTDFRMQLPNQHSRIQTPPFVSKP